MGVWLCRRGLHVLFFAFALMSVAVLRSPRLAHAQDLLVDVNNSNSPYTLSGGSIAFNKEYIGSSSSGELNQSGGTNTVTGGLFLGSASGTIGTYSLGGSGSVLSASGERIGYRGLGTFTQNEGTDTNYGMLTLGYASGSSGTYALSGGTLVSTCEEVVGL